LFCGGTLAAEAALVLGERHAVLDFGADRYTRGRAHPMIDPTLRNQAIIEAGADPGVSVLLLDVILGYGAHPDPAGVVAPAIAEAQRRARSLGRSLNVVAHVVGTDADPQGLERQRRALRDTNVELFASNHAAALAARTLAAGSAA
jgi:FdrA protein